MTAPLYAIGDVHGQRTKLDTALAWIELDGGPQAQVVFVGDYVDRGPDSRGVIELLSEGLEAGRNWTCLKGNHDRFFEWFLNEPSPKQDPHLLVGYHWFHKAIGGVETVASYGIEVPDRIRQSELAERLHEVVPEAHKAFLRTLKTHVRLGDLFFVHAGIRPGVALDRQSENDLLWIRQEFLEDPMDHGVFVVHGHSPVDAPDLRGNRLNLDTGAGYGRPLTAAVHDDGKWYALGPAGRQRITRS